MRASYHATALDAASKNHDFKGVLMCDTHNYPKCLCSCADKSYNDKTK